MTRHWRQFFPFSEPREQQSQAIDFIIDAFQSNKRYVIVELGTGLGKSAIALTVSRYLRSLSGNTTTHGTWYLTTQKVLQQQYIDDFHDDGMRTIKSSSNYHCQMFTGSANPMSCAGVRRLLDAHPFFKMMYKPCTQSCVYKDEKETFLNAGDSITNYSYFLAEARYAKQIECRDLLVCDEAHTIEGALSSFVEFVISERFAKSQLEIKKVPPSSDSMEKVVSWLSKSYKKALAKKLNECKTYMKEHETEVKVETLSSYVKRYELLDKHICKLNRFLEEFDVHNWTMTYGDQKFTFKPVDVSVFAFDHLLQFGSRVIMMSATILDEETFCKTLGIDMNEVAFLKIPSPFLAENRPLHYIPVGSMSKRTIDNTLPNVANAISTILEAHPTEKGVIHAVSFKVAKFIHDHVKSDRLLIHDSNNRDAIMKQHFESSKPTVLLSPSMLEGVDLRDDRSRFQILCKLPYPFLGDEVVKKRMQLNERWYACQTMRSIIQGLGRSIRSEDDHATSYILDSDWERFLKRNKGIVPQEIIDTIVKQ